MRHRTRIAVLAISLLAFCMPAISGAQPFTDHLQTFVLGPPPNTGTSADFSSAPIPADFFGPGSDPFDGIIYFQGDPIAPSSLGQTDVLVLRSADPFDRTDAPGPTMVTVPIEIVELSLRSVEPITVTAPGGPTFWDVHVVLPGPQVPGDMVATKTHANGGLFDSVLPVQPVFTFTNVDDPSDMRSLAAPAPFILEFQDVPWVHDIGPSLQVFVPPGANFIPGVVEVVPGDPNTQQLAPVTGQSVPAPGMPLVEHTVSAPEAPSNIPAISTVGLVVLGLLIFGAGTFLVRRRSVTAAA